MKALYNLDITDSILSDLNDDDIREIHKDYKLQNEYDFNYVIDADEIADYCNPFRNNDKKSLGIVSDEQFIIEFLFWADSKKIYFLEDYFSELINTRIHVLSSINRKKAKESTIRYRDSLIEFIDNISNYDTSDYDYIKKVILAYSFLLSVSTENYKNDLRKINYLFSAPNINYEKKIIDKKVSATLGKYEKDNSKIKKIYNLIGASRPSKKDDINAIYKTYHLTNSFFSEKNQKSIFYFVSSSTLEIETLRKLILERRLDKEFKVDGLTQSFSLIRSKKQIFALLIYNTFGEKVDKDISFESFLGKFKEGVESYKNQIKKDRKNKTHILIEALEKNKFINQEIIENLTIREAEKELINRNETEYNLKIESFENLVSHKIKDKEKGFLISNIREQIKNINEFLNQKFNTISIFSEYGNLSNFINYSLFEIEIINEFLSELTSYKFRIEFDRGADPVESVFNAFPPLFKYDFYKNHIFKLLSEIKETNSEDNQEENSGDNYRLKEFINNEDVIDDLSSKKLFPYILYMLLIVKYTSRGKKLSSNFIAYKHSEDLFYRRKDLLEELEQSTEDKENSKKLKELYKELADILVISCWAARRSRKYESAYGLAQLGVGMFPEDPRFDFLLALNGYCWKYEHLTLCRYEIPYSSSYKESGEGSILDYGENAIKKYKNIENCDKEEYIKQSFIALLNMQAFSSVAKYKEIYKNKDTSHGRGLLRGKKQRVLLKNARIYIYEIYEKLGVKPDNKYKALQNFPEYVHTEVFLVYYEILDSIFMSVKKDYSHKLEAAIEDISFAIESCQNRYDLKKRCIKLLNKLKSI